MALFEYVLLFVLVMAAGLTYLFFRKANRIYLKLLLAFSGAYLFALSITHLIPSVFQSDVSNIGVYILAGFFLQIILEFFSEGIEHGHMHIHHDAHSPFPLTLMISLCLHSLLEGMPLAHSGHHHEAGEELLFGIILHHLPVAFALMSMLLQSGLKTGTAILYLTIFALMAPLGALLGEEIGIELTAYYDRIMAVVIGIFLHISTTILFESSEGHRFNLYKLITIVAGGCLALVSF
jgi:zinc and cadmium transporter